MVLHIPDAEARSLDGSPFSNSTEGYAWMENWCACCVHDSWGTKDDAGPYCPLLTLALSGRTPAEWLDQWDGTAAPLLGGQYHCLMFRGRDGPGGREPEPIPDPPGQGCLVPRGPYTGVRMPLMAPQREAVPA